MRYRILQKGDFYRVQFLVKTFFRGWKWKDLPECFWGDCQRKTFYSLEQAQRAVAVVKKTITANKTGWQIVEEGE